MVASASSRLEASAAFMSLAPLLVLLAKLERGGCIAHVGRERGLLCVSGALGTYECSYFFAPCRAYSVINCAASSFCESAKEYSTTSESWRLGG
jgi:hypothetical protein